MEKKSLKYSDQIYQENLQLKRILNVTIIPQEDDLLVKMYTGNVVYNEGVNALLSKESKSLMDNQSVFDTLISDLIGEDKINGLLVLTRAYVSINEEKDKSINKNEQMQKFFKFFQEIVVNYLHLVLTNPDLFPNMVPESPEEEEGLDLSAWRFSMMLEQGFPNELLAQINDKLYEEDQQVFEVFWEKVLHLILRRSSSSKSTITIMHNAKELVDAF